MTDHKNDLDQILLYGNECCRYDTNKIILLSTISFVQIVNSLVYHCFRFCYVRQKLYLSPNFFLVSNQSAFNSVKLPVVQVLQLYSLKFFCNFSFYQYLGIVYTLLVKLLQKKKFLFTDNLKRKALKLQNTHR